jgi:chaperonin GroEL (HSP60 family)
MPKPEKGAKNFKDERILLVDKSVSIRPEERECKREYQDMAH